MLMIGVVVAAATYTRMAVSPLQETMRVALSLSDNHMALLQGPAQSAPFVLASILIGAAIDRRNRVRLMALLTLLYIGGSVMTAWAPSFGLLFAARCLVGLTTLAMNPTALSLIGDLFAPAQRGRAIMMMSIGQILGMSAAFAIGGRLVVAFGPDDSGWRTALLWMTTPVLLIAVVFLAMREPVRASPANRQQPLKLALAELWRHRSVVLPLLAGEILFQVTFKSLVIWGAPTFERHFSLAADGAGTIMASGLLLSGTLGPIAGGILADTCQRSGGPRRTALLVSGLALLSIAPACFALMPAVSSATVSLFALLTVVSAIAVMGTALFTVVIPDRVRGLSLSVLTGASVLFGGLAPVAVSLLSAMIGGPNKIGIALGLVCALTSLLGAGAFAFSRTRLTPAYNRADVA